MTIAGAVAFPNNGRAIRMNGDPDPGEVDREVCAPVLAGKDTAGLDGLSGPTIKPENPVGLRNRVPAFEVGQIAAVSLAGPDSG